MRFRTSVLFYINEKRFEIGDERAFLTLSDFLRYEVGMTGTKVVCAEGDCGACTVLMASVHELKQNKWVFKSVNSCIYPVFALDGAQLVTVEGLKKGSQLHPVQTAMNENFGSQCGFCTPGFICAMTAMVEESISEKKEITEKRTKNYLTGNLCRCTGYQPILKAAMSLEVNEIESLKNRFHSAAIVKELQQKVKVPLVLELGKRKLFLPTTLKQALQIKNKNKNSRLVAGATDLGVAVNKGRTSYLEMMSLQNVAQFWKIDRKKNYLDVPCRVPLTSLQRFLELEFPELEKMLNIFASPQIKNTGTLVGNVVNASPISDTIPFLLVNDALVVVESVQKKRLIPIDDFFIGYKKLDLKGSEIVTAIRLPLSQTFNYSKLYKVSLRKDLDISAVTMAISFRLKNKKIEEARIAFGGVGPTVARLKALEQSWCGYTPSRALFTKASQEIIHMVNPISDVRGSREYRLKVCQNLLLKLADEMEAEGLL